jgi:hypothetical protein
VCVAQTFQEWSHSWWLLPFGKYSLRVAVRKMHVCLLHAAVASKEKQRDAMNLNLLEMLQQTEDHCSRSTKSGITYTSPVLARPRLCQSLCSHGGSMATARAPAVLGQQHSTSMLLTLGTWPSQEGFRIVAISEASA